MFPSPPPIKNLFETQAVLSPTTPTDPESPVPHKPRGQLEPTNPFLTPERDQTKRIKRLLAGLECRFTPEVQRRCLYALIADSYDEDTSREDMIGEASEYFNQVTQTWPDVMDKIAPTTPFRNVKVERVAEVKQFVDTLAKTTVQPLVNETTTKQPPPKKGSRGSARKKRRVRYDERSANESDTDEDKDSDDPVSDFNTSEDDSDSSAMVEDSTLR